VERRIAVSRPWQAVIIAGCTTIAAFSSLVYASQTSRPVLLPVNVSAYALSYLIAGSVAWLRRPANPIGPVMLATSVVGSLSFFAFTMEPPISRLAGLSGSLANVLVVWIVLAAPSGRLAGWVSRCALAGFVAVVAAAALITDLTLLRVGWAFGVAISLLIAGIVIRRWAMASGASRRSLTPVLVAGVTISLVHAIDFGAGVFLIPVTPGSPIYWADVLSRILVPFGFLLGLLRLRLARVAVADLVVELGRAPAPERLRAALASSLRDPSLAVVYWSPAFRTYADTDGRAVVVNDEDPRRAVTYLEREGEPLAAILHDPALAEDRGLVTAVSAAVRLAVDNERLAAQVREQLEEVRASRTRIVEASDAERRRVERNLHDGAQQRLVALSLALRRAQAQLPADAGPELTTTLTSASEQLKTALAELRQLARGIHPAILTEAGLEPALRALCRESDVPVTVHLDLPERLPEPVEVAAYFVAAEALANVAKYADAGRVALRADVDGDQLRIEIVDDGRGGADPAAGSGLRGLADRVAALSGRLDVRSRIGEGTRVVARLPLGSGGEVPA
jgi:signal transduction histidine kinase